MPSIIRLNILPAAKPAMKKTFEIVAARHRLLSQMPSVQSIAIERYKPMMALKICLISVVKGAKSNKAGNGLLGSKP